MFVHKQLSFSFIYSHIISKTAFLSFVSIISLILSYIRFLFFVVILFNNPTNLRFNIELSVKSGIII